MEYNLTDENFKDETHKDVVLVDFWAEWCGPCRMQAPILHQLSEELPESVIKICKINVDENPNTPRRFKVMGIPTLLFMKNGEIVKKVIGLQTKNQLLQIITELQS